MVVGCQRLIQNTIVLWSKLYLSQKLASIEDKDQRKILLKIIQNGSTMAWQHVNFLGEYDFTVSMAMIAQPFDMEKIMALALR